MNKLYNIFKIIKPVIGMIHMTGGTENEKIKNALEEIEIYRRTGFSGAILEDYHASPDVVLKLIKVLDGHYPIPLGINILRNPYLGFEWASEYNLSFVQFDSVYERDLDLKHFLRLKLENPKIMIFGGIRFKGVPSTGRGLERDIDEGMKNSDAIVTTGDSTREETDVEKLIDFKYTISLIVGSGLNPSNAYTQLVLCDGAIVGSYLKNYDTKSKIIEANCNKLMSEVHRVRGDLGLLYPLNHY